MFSLMICFECDGRLLLSKRAEEGLLAGLREFPTFSWKDKQTKPTAEELDVARQHLQRKCFSLASKLDFAKYEIIGNFKHVFTHINETVAVERVKVSGTVVALASDNISLVRPDEVKKKGVAKSTNKALLLYNKHV
jgi:adenine-specific DNA glycosylase